MNHLNEDLLLKYALELVEGKKEQGDIESHLSACSECRALLRELHSDMDVIGSVRSHRARLDLPVRKSGRNIRYSIIRAAAFIILGIAIGYGGANLEFREKVSVTPSYVTPAPAPDSLIGLAVSDATEITLK